MEVLFAVGALVIGLRVRFWAAAAVAAVDLAAVGFTIIAFTVDRSCLVVAYLLYFVSMIASLAIYVRGRRLPKSHARRETCELLGAVGFFIAIGVMVGAIAAALGFALPRP